MKDNKFVKEIFEGEKGKLLLELSKSYKGDTRFKLDHRFKDDIQQQKLPQKFKKLVEDNVLENKLGKTKIIKKQPSLIIRRFQPGTKIGQINIKKAQGKQKLIENIKKHQQKKKKKNINNIYKGIDKSKKADNIINNALQGQKKKTIFSIECKGDRKQAFQASQFKLFE